MTEQLKGRETVAIIGAGSVGSTLAQRIVERDLANVVLLDTIEGRPQGVALDLMEARAIEQHDRTVIGTQNYADIAGADIVVITAGRPRTPDMTRDELLGVNAQIVASVTREAIAQAPNATFIAVTNPLDVMTYLIWKVSGLPRQQVMGMAGVLDAARFATFVAMELQASAADVTAMVLGGHGDLMVPIPRYTTVRGIPLPQLLPAEKIAQLLERTRDGGAEIGRLLKTGSAYYAPSSSVAQMVEAILRDRHRTLPAAIPLQGEYGIDDLCMGIPVRLGRNGVEAIVKLDLTDEESKALHSSAESVRAQVQRLPDLGLF
ncbi:malate dehydrogenase [Synechococcus sp. PCC 7336]|uniref:malate dehydrogenase n=1 Tax=Synechococcus sp. PCC 7336 TaxID=195250 RepID=UPI000346BF30|nr:malate dehydrogenase [Synechococcus sp. PCC 7336]